MANLPQNKAYAIMNYGATLNGENEKRLNLYYNGSISNGQNVCLWDTDYSTEQKWIFVDDKLKTARNQNFVLSREVTTNNANILLRLSSEDANQKVEIAETQNGNNLYTIKLKDSGKYLTAVNSSNGTASGTSSTSSGNVYWSSSQVGNMSLWRFYEYFGESYPDEPEQTNNPYHALNWGYVFDNLGENFGYYGYDPNDVLAPYEHHHYGIDIICAEGTQLFAPENGTVIAVGGDLSHRQTPDTPNGVIDNNYPGSTMGFFVVLKMDQKDPVSGKDMYVRYLHLKENSHLRYGDRVLKGDVIGLVGNTGTSNTAHLHLDINTKSSGQWLGTGFTANNTINPVNFFPNVNFPSHYYQIGMY